MVLPHLLEEPEERDEPLARDAPLELGYQGILIRFNAGWEPERRAEKSGNVVSRARHEALPPKALVTTGQWVR
jgi:hypothetical protein